MQDVVTIRFPLNDSKVFVRLSANGVNLSLTREQAVTVEAALRIKLKTVAMEIQNRKGEMR